MYILVQWNPVNMVTNGSKKFGRINGVAVLSGQAQRVTTLTGFFYKIMYGRFAGPKKVATKTR